LTTFKYDPFGRRIEKISPTTTSIFAYDGDNLVETTNSSGGEVARYTQGQNIDQPLAMDRSGTIDYYEQDGLGSVTSLTNATGTVAQSYTYGSFGNTTNSSGSLTNFFRYTGREFDTETGLYYYRARYLDASTGRFLGEDPLSFFGGINFYSYVHNNPVNLNDPFGLCDKTKKCKGMARVLEGNADTIGSPGGWSGPSVGNVDVTAGTAAVVTSQWGGKGYLRQYIGQISATTSNGQTLFTGISDIIGGTSPIPGMTAGNALMSLYPGDLIIELPSGKDLGVVPIELTIPASMNCPSGTTPEP
jgi:RHS repeat-associated protein